MTDPEREFMRIVRDLSRRHQPWTVFGDFCEMAAISLANAVTIGELRDEREARYLQIVGRYQPEEVRTFPRLLGLVTMALETKTDDFLGRVFMNLELYNHWRGQYFTPDALSIMMGRLTIAGAAQQTIEERGFVRVLEPAAGSGAMVMAFAEELRAAGYNYQRQLHAECWDVDQTAAHMAVIQLSLMLIPAKIVIGNSLSMEVRDVFHTPAHVLGLWDRKLKRGYALRPDDAKTPEPMRTSGEPIQLGLFGEAA